MSRPLSFLYRSRLGCRIANWRLARHLGRRSLVVHPDVSVHLEPGAQIDGSGRLTMGAHWQGLRYLPSEFKMAKSSRLMISGAFRMHTGMHLTIAEGATLTLLGDAMRTHTQPSTALTASRSATTSRSART